MKRAKNLYEKLISDGNLRHCCSVKLYKRLVKPKTQQALKQIVRAYARKERAKWNTSTAPRAATA